MVPSKIIDSSWLSGHKLVPRLPIPDILLGKEVHALLGDDSAASRAASEANAGHKELDDVNLESKCFAENWLNVDKCHVWVDI